MTNLYKRIKYYLTEMSLDKRTIESNIRHQTRRINDHIIKCLLIQDKTHTLNHWSQEVCSFLDEVPKLKGSNKLPSERLLYNCTIGYFGDVLLERLDVYIESVFEQENMDIPKYNNQALYDCIIDYYKWLVPILSTKGVVKPSEVKSQIITLIQNYNTQTKSKAGV